MQNYTVETFLSHHRDGSARVWLLSFGVANLTLALLILLLLPLIQAHPTPLAPQLTTIEWLPDDALVASAPIPNQPMATPPPVVAAAIEPEPPPPEEHEPAPPRTIDADAIPLAFNNHDTPDETPPPDAALAGLTHAEAQARQPTAGQHDPLPAQPEGVAAPVLAMGTVGDRPDADPGVTLQETTRPGTPDAATATATPAPVPVPAEPPTEAAAEPAAGAATGAPDPLPPTATAPIAPGAGAEPGIGPNQPPPTPGTIAPAEATAPPTPAGLTTPSIPATAPGNNGLVAQGTGDNTDSTADVGPGRGALAAELARLQQLQAVDQATPPGEAGRRSTVQIELPPTQGDSSAVSKTPLWNIRLNAAKQGPDTIETFADPVARYLKDFRRILEQNFYREAGLPRSYRFRDGEYADFAMTFHQDGTIDTVALVPKSATEQFTREMETICKTAIARSSPYNPFTEELKKERDEFTLIVRFQF